MGSKIIKIKNEDLGYDKFFESSRDKLNLGDFSMARVIAEYKGAYRVKNENGEYLANVTGKQMFNASSREDYPAVGDWVAIAEAGPDRAIIHSILPRKTIIKRKSNGKNEVQIIATNIYEAFVVESVGRDYNLNRFERYIAIANDGGVNPVIILNKIDLISGEELNAKLTQLKDRFGNIEIILTSIITDEGLADLKSHILGGKTYCFLGSSGVGKSSLINKLVGENIIKTEDIGTSTERGKHVTTSREMYFLENGGMVIDNPGMREIGMTDTNTGVDNLFDEVMILSTKCKYADCTHTNEPGCEIISALKSGQLSKEKYSNYVNLKKEIKYYEMTEQERREKKREFGKFVNKVKKDLKEHGHKDF